MKKTMNLQNGAIALLLAAVLLLPLLPIFGTEVHAKSGYGIWVGGVEITEENRGDVLGAADAGASVRYDPDTAILTLENAKITGAENEAREHAGIYAERSIELALLGKNSVRAADVAGAENLSGITVLGRLTVSGAGSLTVFAGKGTKNSEGIYANGMVLEGGRVETVASDAGFDSTGLCVNGTLTVTGGTVRARSGEATASHGVYATEMEISGGGVTGLAGDAHGGISIGVSTDEDVRVAGGALLGIAGEASLAYGVYSDGGTVSLNGGTLRAAAGAGVSESIALSAVRFEFRAGTAILGESGTAVSASGGISIGSATMIGQAETSFEEGVTTTLTHLVRGGVKSAVVTITTDRDRNFHKLYVGGIPVTNFSKDDILGDGTARFDPDTKTLTLKNAMIDGLYNTGTASMGIVALQDIRIELVGENSVAASETVAGSGMLSVAIYAGNPVLSTPQETVTFTGSGSLTVTAQDGESVSAALYGYGFTVESGKITAAAGASDADESVGVYAKKVAVNGGRLAASGETAAVYGTVLTVADGATVRNTNEQYVSGTTDTFTQKDGSAPALIFFAKGTVAVRVIDQTVPEGGKVSSTLADVEIDVSDLLVGDTVASVTLVRNGHDLTLGALVILDFVGNDVTEEYRVTVTDGVCHTPGEAVPNGDGTHTYVCVDPVCGKTFENEACVGGITTCFAKAKCAVCDGLYGPEPAHKYKWSGTAERHCRKCSVCGHEKDAGAHVWDEGTVTLEPTVDSEGEKTFTCTVCAYTKTELIDKLPVSSSDGSTTTEDPSWATGETTTDPEWGAGETTTDPEWGAGETTTEPEWGEGETTTEPAGEKDPSKFSWWWLLLLLAVAGGTTGAVIAVKKKSEEES